MPRHAQPHSAVSCAKMDEPIDLPFGLWTRVGRKKHKFNRIRQVFYVPSLERTLAPPGEYGLSAAAMRPYVKLL